jgi:hypothetical protein
MSGAPWPSSWSGDPEEPESEPDIVLSDAAVRALERGERVTQMLITISEGTLRLEGPLVVFWHLLSAVSRESAYCEPCREIVGVFERVLERLGEEDNDGDAEF